MNGIPKKWALFFFAIALLIAVSTCFAAFPREGRRMAYLAVICPPDWRATVSQRYDTRDRRGVITKSVWITRCL